MGIPKQKRGSPNRNGDANHKDSPNRFGDPRTEMGINSPNQSDDEDNDAADAEEGLLGMAAIKGISPDMLERNGVEGGVNLR